MALPDFYILGGQKCGTHWLAANLALSGNVYIPAAEMHFYENDENYGRGRQWYESRFAPPDGRTMIGERTPNYLSVPGVPERIRATTPEALMIVTVRNPVDRAVSALFHSIQMGRYSPWADLDAVISDCLLTGNDPYGVVSYGAYDRHIKRFLDVFPADRFSYVVFEEDILTNPEATVSGLSAFLGVPAPPDGARVTVHDRNSGVKTRLGAHLSRIRPFGRRVGVHAALAIERMVRRPRLGLREDTRRRLREYYRPDVEALEKTIGRDLPGWIQ